MSRIKVPIKTIQFSRRFVLNIDGKEVGPLQVHMKTEPRKEVDGGRKVYVISASGVPDDQRVAFWIDWETIGEILPQTPMETVHDVWNTERTLV